MLNETCQFPMLFPLLFPETGEEKVVQGEEMRNGRAAIQIQGLPT